VASAGPSSEEASGSGGENPVLVVVRDRLAGSSKPGWSDNPLRATSRRVSGTIATA